MDYNPDDSWPQIKSCHFSFMDSLSALTDIKEIHIAHFSYFFAHNSSGNYFPHSHSIIYSSKDRKTHSSIARLSPNTLSKLQDKWKQIVRYEEWKIKPEEPFHSRLVTDATGLARYIKGSHYMLAPGQHWCRLPSYNIELLERKAMEKELREAA